MRVVLPLMLGFLAILCPRLSAAKDASLFSLKAAVSPSCELTVDIRNNELPACWQLDCAKKRSRLLACDLSAMHQIDSIIVAPNRKHLSVVSVGEGHPILEIVALTPLLEQGKYQVACTINPYPGTLTSVDWQGDRLRIHSDVDLALEGIEQRADSIDEEMRSYLVDPADCALHAVDATE
jgi:hypothetical protein